MNVRDVAHLARIRLTDEEATEYQSQLDQILQYVEQLSQIDVDGIEATAHAEDISMSFARMQRSLRIS